MHEATPPTHELAALHGFDLGVVRLGGLGLANLLFPWARAYVASREWGTQLIRPTWPQLKPGTVLRGERDWRNYAFMMRPLPDEVQGWPRLKLLMVRHLPGLTTARIRVHAGMHAHFKPLFAHRQALLTRLQHHCQHPLEKHTRTMLATTVAVHVRLGDFVARSDPEAFMRQGKNNVRLPMQWYTARIGALRRVWGPETPVSLFSDGCNDELAPLLELPYVQRVERGDALSDLLAMRACRHLVASASTFSMWAAFLMDRSSEWYPGSLKWQVNADPDRAQEVP